MKNRQIARTVSLIFICSVFVFLFGYFFSVIKMVSWDVFTTKAPWEWVKPQYALFFNEDEVDIKDVQAFNRVKNILDTRYYEEVNFDDALETSIKGLSAGLKDPYTMYYTPEEMKQFLENTSGNYVGVGVSVHMDENYLLTVADVFAGSPAKQAGILKNDKIVKVDNEDVTQIKDADLIVKKIKGPPGTKVRINVFRQDSNEYKDFELERRQINISYISSEMLPDEIGYIQIKQFDDDIANDFEKQLNNLITQGAKGLVIDLRDNPGGDYNQVVRIADRIVPKGIIVYTEDRQKRKDEEFSDARELNIPLSILVNGYSASASEILSACVQDYDKGTIVGTKTFGKGLVQAIDTRFENGGGLKYTIARYFTPSGKCIHGEGVMPDIEVMLNEEFKSTAIEDIPHKEDAQLKIAIEEVVKKIK